MNCKDMNLNTQVRFEFKRLQDCSVATPSIFSLITKLWFHNDFLVDLNRPKAAAEFHKMFKHVEFLMIRGRNGTRTVGDSNTLSDVYQALVLGHKSD